MVYLETLLWCSSILLKCLSFSPPPPKETIFQKATNAAHFAFVILLASSSFLQILANIIQNSTGSYFMTEHLSYQAGFLQIISKVTMYRINRKKLFKLLDNINNMLKNGSTELKRHLQEYGSIGGIIYLSYMCVILLVAMDICLVPLFKSERNLPLEAWYPFDYKKSTILYTVAYCHQISSIFMFWLCSGVDIIFGVVVFGCCAQYKVIQEKLRGLNKSGVCQLQQRPMAKSDKRTAIEVDKKVSAIVDLHCKICDSVKDINDIYTYILFVLFLTSVIMISCAGFQILNGYENSINSKFIFAGMMWCILFELLFYFLPGDMLVEEAAAVGMAAYHSEWESMPPKYRYYVLLVILRSAKPPRLENGRISPLILKNYAAFLGTTASYFTSLRAIAGVD